MCGLDATVGDTRKMWRKGPMDICSVLYGIEPACKYGDDDMPGCEIWRIAAPGNVHFHSSGHKISICIE